MALHPIIKEDIGSIAGQDLDWSAFNNATVLISGASGFLPAYMVETLLHLNEERGTNSTVVALVRNEEKARRRFLHHQGRSDLKFLVQDVSSSIDEDALGQVDFIVHAASPATPKIYGSDPVGTMLPNIMGTNHLLGLAARRSAKGFLFFSSGEVYGETGPEHIPTKESYAGSVDTTSVRSCYGESKRAGETLCVSWHHQHGVPAKIARLFHTYGPGMNLDDGRVFADFVSDIVNKRNIVMKSDGAQTRAFCYLSDAIAGVFAVLLKGRPAEAYNVGVDKETSIKNLADILVGLFPERGLRVDAQPSGPGAGRLENKISRTCPDISKVQLLGWSPRIELGDGFRRTILSYEDNTATSRKI